MVTGGHPMGINPLEPSRDKPFIEPSHHHHEPMSHHVHDRSGTKVKRSPPLGELDSGVASMSLEDPNGPPDFNKYQNLSKTAINQSNQSKTLQPNALSATQTQYDYDIEKSQTLPERSKSRPDRKKRYLPRNPSLNDSFERKPFRSQVCVIFISRVFAVKNSILRAFIPHSRVEQARRADSEYVTDLVISCHFGPLNGFLPLKLAKYSQTRYISGICTSNLFE